MTHHHDRPAARTSPPGTTPVPPREPVCPRHPADSERQGVRLADPYDTREAAARSALARVWARVAPLLPPPAERRSRYPGRRPVPDRVVLSVVLHVLREGIPWHTARTGELGCSGVTAWRRLRVWARADTWPRIREAVLGELDGPARLRAVHALAAARSGADGSAAHPGPVSSAAPPEPRSPSPTGTSPTGGEDDDALVAAITRAVAAADEAVLGPLLRRLAGRADTRVVLRLGEALAVASASGLPDRASRAAHYEPASTSVHARSLPETTRPTPTSVNRQSSRS
ncbi:transposase [Streptomyces sp. PsTaAH-124]|uniref:transposase n=1 Tax=Streptomyces sp. PsTaAH-124 TaxID=1157638 RepID=UPI0006878C77|nr:transposase [Streptomyces sp. PsTaAH-124]